MLALLSPAKTLDLTPAAPEIPHTQPGFLTHTRKLIRRARALTVPELRELMSISEDLAQLNAGRFRAFRTPLRPGEAKQAALAFSGDVYRGLDAAGLSPEQLDRLQARVRILSGLYGVLRPLDLIHPYRLEMGTCLENERGKDLYRFWGDRLAKSLAKELKTHAVPVVVNLASNEYSRAALTPALKARVVTPVFQEVKDGVPKVISFVAKHSRGVMARWMVERDLEDVEDLKDFRVGKYRFVSADSTADRWVFRRKHVTKAAKAA